MFVLLSVYPRLKVATEQHWYQSKLFFTFWYISLSIHSITDTIIYIVPPNGILSYTTKNEEQL